MCPLAAYLTNLLTQVSLHQRINKKPPQNSAAAFQIGCLTMTYFVSAGLAPLTRLRRLASTCVAHCAIDIKSPTQAGDLLWGCLTMTYFGCGRAARLTCVAS